MLKAEVLKAKKKWLQREPLRRMFVARIGVELPSSEHVFESETIIRNRNGHLKLETNSNLSFLRLFLAEDRLSALDCQNDS